MIHSNVKVFISYAHSTPEHTRAVADLAEALRSKGLLISIDTDIKNPQGPEEGWPKWMKRQLKVAKWVLLFFDEVYRRRFDGEADAGRALGATFEGAIITHHYYRNSALNKKFIPILTDNADLSVIPDELFGYNRFFVPTQTDELASALVPSQLAKTDADLGDSKGNRTSLDTQRQPGKLEALYLKREEALTKGECTLDIDREIRKEKRRLRNGKPLGTGDILADRYLLLQHIARGGIGSIWKAWDRKFKKYVALKFLLPERVHDSKYRFFRGAEQMAALEHPSIVRIIEPSINEDEYFFFAMQLVEGRNLFDLVKEGRLDREQILDVTSDVADALQYAYDTHGLIHRDVKPGNILVDQSHRGLLIDFDLVRAPNATPMSTVSGLGTRDFAAPEAFADGSRATHQSDIYSLAKTALWALSGGKSISNDPRELRAATGRLKLAPRQVSAILGALRDDPDQRPRSIRQFAEALTRTAPTATGWDQWSHLPDALAVDKLEETVLDDLIQAGPDPAPALVSIIKRDFLEPQTKEQLLNLATIRQRRAIYILSKMTNDTALQYLHFLSPPGMFLVSAGRFLMGSDEFENEQPSGEVWVDSFWMAEYPVSNSEFLPFIQDGYRTNRYWTRNGWDSLQSVRRTRPNRWENGLERTQPNHPVQWLSWYEANAFARWLASRTESFYRLPTEAQWEKAASWDARAQTKRKYPWGNHYDVTKHPTRWSAPKGEFLVDESLYRLQHMCGNVWQWTSSLRWTYPYIPDDGREDPERNGDRVMRGGCWANHGEIDYYRCTSRYHPNEPVPPTFNLDPSREGPCGFRLCLSITRSDLELLP